jgi:hypothetical protein
MHNRIVHHAQTAAQAVNMSSGRAWVGSLGSDLGKIQGLGFSWAYSPLDAPGLDPADRIGNAVRHDLKTVREPFTAKVSPDGVESDRLNGYRAVRGCKIHSYCMPPRNLALIR